jgi:hypothetical protein
MSQTGNRRFRDSFISYVHYKANGEIADIRVDGIGVGEYEVTRGRIEAENYFAAMNVVKQEIPDGFGVVPTRPGGYLVFPNVRGLTHCNSITLRFSSTTEPGRVEVREEGPEGALLTTLVAPKPEDPGRSLTLTGRFKRKPGCEKLCLRFSRASTGVLDAFTLGQ